MIDTWEVHPCKDRLGHVTSYDICLPQEPGSSGVAVIASVYSGEEVAKQIADLWNTRNKASTIPTDAEVAALVEKAKPLLECEHRANRPNPRQKGERIVGFAIGENDIGLELSEPLFALDALIKLAHIGAAKRLSTIPSAGDGLTLPREGLEDALFDALYDSVGLMGVATRRAAKACVTALEVHSALSIQTISGKGMREALAADRDEWKQQHENLLSVRASDNATMLKARDKWMLLAQRALAYLSPTLGITKEIRAAVDPNEIDAALKRLESEVHAALVDQGERG